MAFWSWILQVLVLLVVWKVIHLLYWNLRKALRSPSVFLSMVATLVIAVLGVVAAHVWHSAWSEVLLVGVLLGIAGGEYEYNRGGDK
ncbi:MAG: hypothetical protein OWT28_05245 [Firmicutes bacterium]|nr:hypothetical protein [Bacillota bacterium]